ncbi:MAG TPA: hypothetical protein VFE25_16440 [Opitutaceae bacterium]|jgi:hypothetical protein|nr:hypothetical protein [Opitutaceae bacterium]
MSMEFGWWNNNPEEGKYQVVANVHGGKLDWQRKQGHHNSWMKHVPSEDDWERLIFEAKKRVPRRLLSPKQFDVIQNLKDRR